MQNIDWQTILANKKNDVVDPQIQADLTAYNNILNKGNNQEMPRQNNVKFPDTAEMGLTLDPEKVKMLLTFL